MLPKSPVTGTYASLELRRKRGTGKEVRVLSAQKWLKPESGGWGADNNPNRALKSAGLSPRVHSHLKEIERKIIHPFCRGLTSADPEQSQPGVGSRWGPHSPALRVFPLVCFHHCLKSCLQMGHEPPGIFLKTNIFQLLFTFCVEKYESN